MSVSPSFTPGGDDDWLTATEIIRMVRRREVSPVEVVNRSLRRLEAVEPAINAFVTVTAELALAAARHWEAVALKGEELPPLAGLPISIKDNIALAGAPLTFGSRTRTTDAVDFDAPVVERLKRAGVSIIGKTTMTEFGCKASSDSPLTGLTRNPWDLSRSAGGSSSGSAASVAAGVVPAAVGTDGAGSVRIPASFCGLFGIKPQFGRVPIFPAPTALSMFHIGPLARTVRDGALLLREMAGYDARDMFGIADSPPDYVAACDAGIAGWSIGWSPTLGFADPVPEVLALASKAAAELGKAGCRVEEAAITIDDPHEIVVSEFAPGGAYRLQETLERQSELMDPEVAELLTKAASMQASEYFRGHFARHDLRQKMLGAFKHHRLLVTPTLPVTAFAAEASKPPHRSGASILSWPSYPALQNLTGFPAASVPCGRTADGLPVGLQMIARPHCEADLFAAAAALEALRPFETRATAR